MLLAQPETSPILPQPSPSQHQQHGPLGLTGHLFCRDVLFQWVEGYIGKNIDTIVTDSY